MRAQAAGDYRDKDFEVHPLLRDVPEQTVEMLRGAVREGDLRKARSLIGELENTVGLRAGASRAQIYTQLREEVLRYSITPQRASYEAFLLEAGALSSQPVKASRPTAIDQ